jgi:hypothetical protein
MHRICWAALFIVVASGTGYCQQTSDKNVASICGYEELYHKAGWEIPGIKGARKKNGRMSVPGNPEVFRTELEPHTRASTIQTFRCSREHSGRLEIEDIDIGIGSLSSFEVAGKIFAYGVTYGVRVIENGQPIDTAAEWSLKFYDLDGSGRFTVRRSERERFVPEFIPAWVKGRANAKAGQDLKSLAVPSN